ncbi:putative alpha/beta hydrolase-1 [Helianthus annuus]|uniref:Putative alpha/beta-Hydrolases superfamily protein n=1 Tax=Helianthus annuus TaxID=4232 RepID=A0A251UF44_HELAN|nr:probable lysophospholipase BODYGUARD 4 [Helianthus annuus]XP_021969225.1 probable lysophospholipase BODYGUARD 4 [Helianthus annuus]XP_035843144.1 probable lysophospholipase BODYGUARD 4 [Helianthus annuus]KAJ0910285.1 putative alpha/beta hydrolase-1 [Helianthus annuus]
MADYRGKLPRKIADIILYIINSLVFFFLDLLDYTMCIFYKYIDEFLEGKSTPCYCQSQNRTTKEFEKRNNGVSGTLFGRKNVFKEMGFIGKTRRMFDDEDSGKTTSSDLGKTRWSDCGCESCLSWMNNGGDLKLHVVVKDPLKGNQDLGNTSTEDVIFLHGFMSSSYIWTETIFPELVSSKYRLFAVDLLGFGSSPKPRECLYTLNDHLEMIEKSVIREFDLKSFHLVAHSMGCIIALALAAKYPNSLKSITLVAPPYFITSEEEDPSEIALKRLAYKSVWPPLLFGSAFMTWYEHLGRCVCFVLCRHHKTWEKILKLVTRKRKLSFLVMDLFRHTHHSAWHTMHNVICGGAKMMDPCLEILRRVGARVTVVQGSRDQVVPVECSNNIKVMVPDAEVKIIKGANHNKVIMGREKQFAEDLEHIWDSVNDAVNSR